AKVKQLATAIDGTDGEDNLVGWSDMVSIMKGYKGNDTISGNRYNDTLDGGEGNDSLNGGYGADTYIFKKGYGVDKIDNYTGSDYTSDIDVLKMEDINESEVLARRVGNDLELRVKNADVSLTGDKVVVAGYFYYGTYAVDKIQFADGTIWDTNSVNKAIDLNNHIATLSANTVTSINYSSLAEVAVHEINAFTTDSSMYNSNQYNFNTVQNSDNNNIIIKTS
ncbi:hypothetical protein JHL18_10480, partial [Clostridium sp. YIM B02505]